MSVISSNLIPQFVNLSLTEAVHPASASPPVTRQLLTEEISLYLTPPEVCALIYHQEAKKKEECSIPNQITLEIFQFQLIDAGFISFDIQAFIEILKDPVRGKVDEYVTQEVAEKCYKYKALLKAQLIREGHGADSNERPNARRNHSKEPRRRQSPHSYPRETNRRASGSK